MKTLNKITLLTIGATALLTANTAFAHANAPIDLTKAAESTVNGVVSIKSYASPRSSYYGGQQYNDPLFDFFFGRPQQRNAPQRRQYNDRQQRQTGLGSGVILTENGYIVTNNHVIDGAERLEVTLNDNRSFNATVIGTDPSTDVALIKIDANDLQVIPMGDSEELKIGEWVLAVGNPFGFTSTVTTGIVSAKARNISTVTGNLSGGIESFIQTDAAVNPGNSGGALVNLNGELVGINTAIFSQTGNYAGYSFAVPTSIVNKVVTDIMEYGTVQRAVLGIGFVELTPDLAREQNITATTYGIYVGTVYDRSAAFEGGLQVGDVIIAVNGTPTKNTANLQESMAKHRPGDVITITYIRGGEEFKTDITLRNSSGSTELTSIYDFSSLGCAFKKVPEATLKQLELSNGIQVTGLVDGKFKEAGVKDELIILQINGQIIKSKDDIEQIYAEIIRSNDPDKVMFIVGVYPTGKKEYLAVDISE